MDKFTNKVVVITGSGAGIGRETAIKFAREGAKVQVLDINLEAAEDTVKMIQHEGGKAEAYQCNVSVKKEVNRVIQGINEVHKSIDVMVNNAGVAMKTQDTEEVSEDEVNRILDINVKGLFWGIQSVLPIMKKQQSGVIVNTSSMIGVKPRPQLSVYGASKAAVNNLTKGIALEVAQFGIRVVGVNPVGTYTELLKEFIGEDRNFEKGVSDFEASVPLGRLATPSDVANAILFLASDDAALVTGSFVDIDGGRGIS